MGRWEVEDVEAMCGRGNGLGWHRAGSSGVSAGWGVRGFGMGKGEGGAG